MRGRETKFFRAVVEQARKAHLMSSEHFTVDGTIIDAWASLKTFKKKDAQDDDTSPPDDPGNPTVNFHGEKRSGETHACGSVGRLSLTVMGERRRLAEVYCPGLEVRADAVPVALYAH